MKLKFCNQHMNPRRNLNGNTRILSIVIEDPRDDLNIDDMGDMMRAALLAMGYAPDSVDELIAPR